MNHATSHLAAFGLLEEYTGSVTLAEENIPDTWPTLVHISNEKLLPSKSQRISNAPPFRQAQVNLTPVAAYTTTEAYSKGLRLHSAPLPPGEEPRVFLPVITTVGSL